MTALLLRFIVVSSAILGSALGAATVHAQNSCQPFTLTPDMNQRSAVYLDLGASRVTPGDLRIGRVVLVDETGNEAGIMRWATRSLDTPPGAGEVSHSLSNYVILLEDGQIHIQSVAETVRPADNVGATSVGDLTGAVLGGTGAYRLARGNVDISTDDGVIFFIDIRCD